MLNTINVVKIKDGVVDSLYSFAPDQKDLAEKKFIEECRLLGMNPDEASENDEESTLGEDALNDGYYEIVNASICLAHSCTE